MTIWCIVAVYVWRELFFEWVYADETEPIPMKTYELADNLLQVSPT